MVRKLYQNLHHPHHHHHVILRAKAKRQNPRSTQYAMVWGELKEKKIQNFFYQRQLFGNSWWYARQALTPPPLTHLRNLLKAHFSKWTSYRFGRRATPNLGWVS